MSLAFGLTEQNPAVVRRALALRPRYLRVMVIWGHVQPDAAPLTGDSWRRLTDPRPRGVASVNPAYDVPYAGVQAQLEFAQREGLEVLLSVVGPAPAWTGGPEVAQGYEALVAGVLELAAGVSCRVLALAPWNEPNHPMFIARQRAGGALLSPATYLALCDRAGPVCAARGVRLMVGELAGFLSSGPNHVGVADFVGELHRLRPGALNGLFSVHDYAPAKALVRSSGVVEAAQRALAVRGHRPALFVGETGADTRWPRRTRRQQRAMICRWKTNPQVRAAFQYTFRGDPAFPVGLARPNMSALEGSYDLWKAV